MKELFPYCRGRGAALFLKESLDPVKVIAQSTEAFVLCNGYTCVGSGLPFCVFSIL